MKRRGFLQHMVFGASAAAALPAAATASASNLQAEIEALLRETEAAWDSQDTTAVRDLWDLDDTDPFYLAAEQEDWFVGWDAINAYLAPPPGSPQVTEAIRVRFSGLHTRLLAPDLAVGAYWMRTDMKLVWQEKPFGSNARVSAIFRKTPEGWRYVCYMEGFQSPNIYMQKLYENNISPDYDEFYREKTQKGS